MNFALVFEQLLNGLQFGVTLFLMAAGLTLALGLAGTLVVGMLVEIIALRTLYERDHLDQVLATFGLILFFNELIAVIWGRAALYMGVPPWLSGHVPVLPGVRYPVYRALIIVV